LHELGIAYVGFAIAEGQVERLGQPVDIRRRVVSERAEVRILEDLQRFEQRDPLAPGVAGVHLVAAPADGD
jgi:hypothetical protein